MDDLTTPDAAARPRTRLLPPAPFALALLAGWALDRWWLALPLGGGGWRRGAGIALVVAAFAGFGWALATMRRHRTAVNPYRAATALCTDGPFRFSRNPIYVSDWLLLAGVALWLDTAWPLLFAPAVWALLRYAVIRHEEAHLAARFGAEWQAYRARVRRWL